MDYTNEQERCKPFNLEAAEELMKVSQQVDYPALLQNTDVFYFGEAHTDYSISTHLQSQVKNLKEGGVITFALELNPQLQPILDAISNGDLSQLDKIAFSHGLGSKSVEKNKRAFIRTLVEEGIK